MNTNTLVYNHNAREAAKRSRCRRAELQALGSAGAMVFTGLLLAVLYCLVTHRIVA